MKRRLAVDGDEVRSVGPHLPHPGGEAGRKRSGIDPVHQQGEPTTAGNAVVMGRHQAAPCQGDSENHAQRKP